VVLGKGISGFKMGSIFGLHQIFYFGLGKNPSFPKPLFLLTKVPQLGGTPSFWVGLGSQGRFENILRFAVNPRRPLPNSSPIWKDFGLNRG